MLCRFSFIRISRTISVTCTRKKMSFKYPVVRRDDKVKETLFGHEIADPYRWLEDPEAPETKSFVEAQNAVTRPYIDSCPYKDTIKNKITKLWNYPKFSTPFRHGDKYYQHRNTGLQNQSVIFVQDDLNSEASVFLDPNLLSEDGTVALSGTTFSEDGKTFAYGLSASGSDWIEIKFKNVDTKEDYPETLRKVKFSPMTWMHDNKGFFYGAYLDQDGKSVGTETKEHENQKLYYHELGTEQAKDAVVVEFEDPQLRIGAHVSHCGRYLVITATKGCKNNLLYFAKLNAGRVTKLPLTEVVTEFVADFEYITNVKNLFYFRTNKNAANYRIILIDFDNPKESEWKDLIPEHKKDVLYWAHHINDNKLVICYMQDVKNVLDLFDINSGKKIHNFKLDVGTIVSISGKPHHDEMFFSFCSFLTPNIIYRVKFSGEQQQIEESVFHETKVGDFDASKFETTQIFYPSKDGTQIPMFIVSKKGLVRNGQSPCLLYGYGGFNINLTPSFGVSRLVFVENFDGIFVLANIRGGGEYGDRWHNSGRFAQKQNCFDDFQHAAKYLVRERYTSVDKLTIQGGSNGGLLVAACINQAPELFGAAVCQVGVLDMLRFHKFTIGYAWKSDYGCADEEEQFDYLYKYSPLHNIRTPKGDRQYPATLLLTADNDDRVVPLHSLKFIAELQDSIGKLENQKQPVMILIETRAGHGAGKPTSKIIEELTDVFCFISRSLNITFHS